MPIIKSNIKRMKQSAVAKDRNKHYSSRMKSLIKLFLDYIKKDEMDKAKSILPEVTKSIDMAAKKNIIHGNNAARKKSRIQRNFNNGPAKKTEKAGSTSKKEAKVKVAKESVSKKEDGVEEKELA